MELSRRGGEPASRTASKVAAPSNRLLCAKRPATCNLPNRRQPQAHLPPANRLVERAHEQVRGSILEDLLKQPLQRETTQMARIGERQGT